MTYMLGNMANGVTSCRKGYRDNETIELEIRGSTQSHSQYPTGCSAQEFNRPAESSTRTRQQIILTW